MKLTESIDGKTNGRKNGDEPTESGRGKFEECDLRRSLRFPNLFERSIPAGAALLSMLFSIKYLRRELGQVYGELWK